MNSLLSKPISIQASASSALLCSKPLRRPSIVGSRRKGGSITEGRWGTVKSHLNHLSHIAALWRGASAAAWQDSSDLESKACRATSSIVSRRAPKTSPSRMSRQALMLYANGHTMKVFIQYSTTYSPASVAEVLMLTPCDAAPTQMTSTAVLAVR